MDERLKRIVDNVRVCVDGQIRIVPVPEPAADATRPIALAMLLAKIDEAQPPPCQQCGTVGFHLCGRGDWLERHSGYTQSKGGA